VHRRDGSSSSSSSSQSVAFQPPEDAQEVVQFYGRSSRWCSFRTLSSSVEKKHLEVVVRMTQR